MAKLTREFVQEMGGSVGSADAILAGKKTAGEAIGARNKRAEQRTAAVSAAITRVRESYKKQGKSITKAEAASELRSFAKTARSLASASRRGELKGRARTAAIGALRKKYPWFRNSPEERKEEFLSRLPSFLK